MTKGIKNLTSSLHSVDSTIDTICPSCHQEPDQQKVHTTKSQHLLLRRVLHRSADKKQTEHSARQYRCRPLPFYCTCTDSNISYSRGFFLVTFFSVYFGSWKISTALICFSPQSHQKMFVFLRQNMNHCNGLTQLPLLHNNVRCIKYQQSEMHT